MGEYLENIYVDSNYYVEGQSSSIGELISHRHDSKETLIVPVLTAQDNRPFIKSYALVQNVDWIEHLGKEEADLIFLANGVSVRMNLTVSDR